MGTPDHPARTAGLPLLGLPAAGDPGGWRPGGSLAGSGDAQRPPHDRDDAGRGRRPARRRVLRRWNRTRRPSRRHGGCAHDLRAGHRPVVRPDPGHGVGHRLVHRLGHCVDHCLGHRLARRRRDGGGAASPPRGGTTLFPRYRLVGYSGAPGSKAFGRLGVGDLDERVDEIERRARPYADGRTVLPVLEPDHRGGHRQPRRGRRLLAAGARRHDRAVPEGGPSAQGAAAARRPARPGRLPAAGEGPAPVARAAGRRPGARPRVGRRAEAGSGAGVRPNHRGRGSTAWPPTSTASCGRNGCRRR
nr:hypothetical protein [Angustibacter aerolatus]